MARTNWAQSQAPETEKRAAVSVARIADAMSAARDEGAVTPLLEREYAKRSIEAMNRITDQTERFYAASEIGMLAREFAEFKAELEERNSSLSVETEATASEMDQLIEQKHERDELIHAHYDQSADREEPGWSIFDRDFGSKVLLKWMILIK